MFEQTERHIFFLVLGFQRIRRLSYHATQGFNLLLVSIMVDVPSSLRMLKGPSSYFTFIPVWLVYDLCNWLFADEKCMRKTQDSQFPSHPRHSTATDPGVFLQRHPRQKRVWSWWSMGHLNRFPISGQPKWTISKRLGSTNLHPNMYPFIHWKHKRLDGGYIVVPKYVGNNCSQISLVERSPTFFWVFNNNTFETTNIPSPVFPKKCKFFFRKVTLSRLILLPKLLHRRLREVWNGTVAAKDVDVQLGPMPAVVGVQQDDPRRCHGDMTTEMGEIQLGILLDVDDPT